MWNDLVKSKPKKNEKVIEFGKLKLNKEKTDKIREFLSDSINSLSLHLGIINSLIIEQLSYKEDDFISKRKSSGFCIEQSNRSAFNMPGI